MKSCDCTSLSNFDSADSSRNRGSFRIVDFAWEPDGNRFLVIFGENARPDVSLYTMKEPQFKQVGETLEKKPANNIVWAPQGQFCVLAGLQSPALNVNGVLEFWDMGTEKAGNPPELMGYQEHLMCNGVVWDPTGRYVSTYVSALRQTHSMENGYNIYNSQVSSRPESRH